MLSGKPPWELLQSLGSHCSCTRYIFAPWCKVLWLILQQPLIDSWIGIIIAWILPDSNVLIPLLNHCRFGFTLFQERHSLCVDTSFLDDDDIFPEMHLEMVFHLLTDISDVLSASVFLPEWTCHAYTFQALYQKTTENPDRVVASGCRHRFPDIITLWTWKIACRFGLFF